MIDDVDAIARIVQSQLEIVVLQFPVPWTAVQPAWQARIVGVDVIHFLQRLQTKRLETVVNPSQWKRIGMLDSSETFLADGDVLDLSAFAGNLDQGCGRLVIRKVRDTENVDGGLHANHRDHARDSSPAWA